MSALSISVEAAQAKKEQILQGALKIFFQQGYEGTSMDRVAIAAGVSKITIYKHFQNKQDLFEVLVKWVTSARFESAFEALSVEQPPKVVLRQVAKKLLSILADDDEYLAFLRLIIGESGRFPDLAQLFVKSLPQTVWIVLRDYLKAQPTLRCEHPEAAARIFMGSLISHVLTQKLLYGEAIAPMDDAVLIDALVALMIGPEA
ncbi:MAG: TetR/AcrR family transcriptional regulator [Cyanobacteria bacterium P01_A01_bin.116]